MLDEKKMQSPQVAFLLAQIGAHAATIFAEKLNSLQLGPADAGILRMLRITPGISQQELSRRLKIHPSRLVAIIDNLESRQFIERQPNLDDRRLYSLFLSKIGDDTLEQIGQVARTHQLEFCSSLNSHEIEQLSSLLQRLAVQHGLAGGVHPGYQSLSDRNSTSRKIAPKDSVSY